MKRILTSLVLVASVYSFAQVSISGENNHTPKATLDIEAIGADGTADGILIPRVDREKAQNMQHVKHSTLIYVDNITKGTQSGQANQIDAKGFYYFDTESNSGEWVKLGGGASATQTWEQIKAKKGGMFVITAKNQTAPKDTWLIYGSGNLSPVKLPKMEEEDQGRMIVVFKEGDGSLQVQDYKGLVMKEDGATLVSESSVRANRGRTFLWTGTKWVTINY